MTLDHIEVHFKFAKDTAYLLVESSALNISVSSGI